MTLRNEKGSPRPVVLPANEQPFPPPGAAAPIASGRDELGRVRTSDAARALASLPRRGAFLPRPIACHPRFEAHNKRRLDWQRARSAELCDAFGHVSHAVSAMLAAAAWLYAGAEFASELAAEAGDVAGFKTAAQLSGVARQHELGAWELCARESKVHAERGSARELPPWFVRPEETRAPSREDSSGRIDDAPEASLDVQPSEEPVTGEEPSE